MLPHFLSLTNTSRVLEDLHALRGFGSTGGGLHGFGVSRPALSDEDVEARRWLMKKMEAAGLTSVQMDGLGTLYGSAGIDTLPALLMGSHTDTQPQGGWLDGALGVAYALETSRVLRQGGAADLAAWSVAVWADEEGRFGTLTASSAFAGRPLPSSRELWQARARHGLAGVPVMHASGRHGGWAGYLEAHIEQGPQLERSAASLGVVSAIVGLRQLRIECVGEQNHAGTTAMVDRRDATLEAMRLAAALDEKLATLCAAWADGGCAAVWTFSGLDGFVSASTVSGTANLTLQFRAPEENLLEAMHRLVGATVGAAAAGAHARRAATCAMHTAERAPVVATEMDAGLAECFRRAAVATVGEERVVTLPSAALHDASPLAEVMPAAMLFVPSMGGVSHSFDEHTREEDIAAGAEAFVRAAVQLALGECASERGPSCVVQDARLARLWANAIDASAAEEGAEDEGADADDLSLYPEI